MDESKTILMNRPQILLHLINANKTYCLWGRATGKSNGGLGPRSIHLMNTMPGAQIGLVAPSYVMAFKQIINNIAGFWQNEMGLLEGENYVIGKRPPVDWPRPLLPVQDFKYVISFDNGSVMPILSLEVEGSGNGFNLQALLGDEAKFFNEKRLKEIIRGLRGGYKKFGHLPEFQSQWYFTDKYDGDIEWILAKRKLQDDRVIKAVLAMQLEVNRLLISGDDSPETKRLINRYTKLMNERRKDLVFVSEAGAEENREILGDKFFQDQKELSTDIEYDVAINNLDPDKVENSFYPDLAERHYYTIANDVDPGRPLIIAADYQWRISPIVTAQYGVLPGENELSFNIVYSCDELHPKGLVDAVDLWCNHFKLHIDKTVYYMFDKTAVGKSPSTKPFFEVVKERLQFNGWNVVLQNMGETPKHDDKFKMISRHLKGVTGRPPVRINALRNEHLIRSMNLTKAMTYFGKTSKDKSSEKNMSIPARKSTHYSDVIDMLLYSCLELKMVQMNNSAGFGMILR